MWSRLTMLSRRSRRQYAAATGISAISPGATVWRAGWSSIWKPPGKEIYSGRWQNYRPLSEFFLRDPAIILNPPILSPSKTCGPDKNLTHKRTMLGWLVQQFEEVWDVLF